MDKPADVVLEIENLPHSSDKSSGSPKVKKALSRKGSSRNERRNSEEQEAEESSRKLVVKVPNSQLEPLTSAKPQIAVATTTVHGYSMIESTDGRSKRFNRLSVIHPKRILLIFATLSVTGTGRAMVPFHGFDGRLILIKIAENLMKVTHLMGDPDSDDDDGKD